MTYHLFSCDKTRARKQYRCIWCGEHVLPGESYFRERSVYDGRFQNHAWHPECKADQEECFREYGDTEFIAHQAERPVAAKGDTQ